MVLATAIVSLLGTSMSSSVAAQAANDVAVQAQKAALDTWHDSIKRLAPPTEGCFHATYPSVIWERENCLPASAHHAVVLPRLMKLAGSHQEVMDTAGDGTDYSAKTSSLTSSAVGSFPTVTGVTAKADYTLQLNTNFGVSSACNKTYGYSSCETWEQFIYATTGEDTSGTPPQAYIQNWIFLSSTDYKKKGCPSGWEAYAPQYACFTDSAAVNTSDVALSSLGSVKLSGSASTSGNDVVTFTYGTTAKSVSQKGTTLSIGTTWNQSEFNVVGDGGGSGLSFNKGSSLAVKLQASSGSSTTISCVGPTNGGTTAETNNLTLGKCTASSGANAYIQFTESD